MQFLLVKGCFQLLNEYGLLDSQSLDVFGFDGDCNSVLQYFSRCWLLNEEFECMCSFMQICRWLVAQPW